MPLPQSRPLAYGFGTVVALLDPPPPLSVPVDPPEPCCPEWCARPACRAQPVRPLVPVIVAEVPARVGPPAARALVTLLASVWTSSAVGLPASLRIVATAV